MKALQDEQKQHKFNQNKKAAYFQRNVRMQCAEGFVLFSKGISLFCTRWNWGPYLISRRWQAHSPSTAQRHPAPLWGPHRRPSQSGLVLTPRCCPIAPQRSKKPRALVLVLRHLSRDGAGQDTVIRPHCLMNALA